MTVCTITTPPIPLQDFLWNLRRKNNALLVVPGSYFTLLYIYFYIYSNIYIKNNEYIFFQYVIEINEDVMLACNVILEVNLMGKKQLCLA